MLFFNIYREHNEEVDDMSKQALELTEGIIYILEFQGETLVSETFITIF